MSLEDIRARVKMIGRVGTKPYWMYEVRVRGQVVFSDNTCDYAAMAQAAREDVFVARRCYLAGYRLDQITPRGYGL